MKALVAAYEASPSRGSEPGYGWSLPTALAAAGVDVHVITDERWRSEIEAADRTTRSAPTFHYVSPREPPPGLRTGRRRVYADYLAWQRQCLVRARELDVEHRFDVAHHLNWGSLFWGSTLEHLGIPFVFGPVGGGQTSPKELRAWFGRAWRFEVARNWALRAGLPVNLRARRTARGADVLLATNTETAHRARSLGAPRVELCLDTALWPEGLRASPRAFDETSEPTALWVGRNLPRKGISLALQSFAVVVSSLPSARLVMLGEGLDDLAVTEQIESLGLGGSVTRPGRVALSEVVEWFDVSSVLLFSSLRESFGAQVLEAMARGLPVVALDIHGVADFMPDAAGVKIPLGRGDGLAQSMGAGVLSLLTSERAWLDASRAGQAAAARHTWEGRARDLVGRFEQISAHGARRASARE